jgi:hypothetical protein
MLFFEDFLPENKNLSHPHFALVVNQVYFFESPFFISISTRNMSKQLVNRS